MHPEARRATLAPAATVLACLACHVMVQGMRVFPMRRAHPFCLDSRPGCPLKQPARHMSRTSPARFLRRNITVSVPPRAARRVPVA